MVKTTDAQQFKTIVANRVEQGKSITRLNRIVFIIVAHTEVFWSLSCKSRLVVNKAA